MQSWTLTQIRAFLAPRLPGLAVHAASRFPGGFWNDVQRLDTSDGTLVFKRYLPIPEGSLFPNLPADEARALTRLAGLDVAPALVAFWPEAPALLYRHVPGAEWQNDVVSAAHLLRRQSRADPSGFRRVPTQSSAILAEGDRLLARCQPSDLTARLHACRPLPTDCPPGPLSLIHTDTAPANLVGKGAGLRLIDWQCPAAGDLAEDVAVLLSPAFLTLYQRPLIASPARRLFLDTLSDPALETRLAALEPAYGWRLAAYCALRLQTTQDPDLAARYRSAALAQALSLQGGAPT
jgi:thiamine kinase